MTTRQRLFVMMVLEFFIWGAWLPLIFGYLPSLGFTPAPAVADPQRLPGGVDRRHVLQQPVGRPLVVAGARARGLAPHRRPRDPRLRIHAILPAVLRADARALPALRADDLDHQLDRVRQHEERRQGVRPRAHGRHDRLDSGGLAVHVHLRQLAGGGRGADRRAS